MVLPGGESMLGAFVAGLWLSLATLSSNALMSREKQELSKEGVREIAWGFMFKRSLLFGTTPFTPLV